MRGTIGRQEPLTKELRKCREIVHGEEEYSDCLVLSSPWRQRWIYAGVHFVDAWSSSLPIARTPGANRAASPQRQDVQAAPRLLSPRPHSQSTTLLFGTSQGRCGAVGTACPLFASIGEVYVALVRSEPTFYSSALDAFDDTMSRIEDSA